MSQTLWHDGEPTWAASYHGRVSELPSSARLALWMTHSWNGGPSTSEALARSFPGLDHIAGDLGRLDLWRDLGERALFVALPRPGDVSRMPSGSPAAAAQAADSGECVFVAGIGGVLAPTLSQFGPDGDTGVRADWQAYEADPVPRHRLEMLDLRQVHQQLLARVAEHADRFEVVGGAPWGNRRSEVQAGLGAGLWGVPPATPVRALQLMALAADVARIAERTSRLTTLGSGGLDAGTAGSRGLLLRSLTGDADDALADATNIAVMSLAGWRPAL